MPIKIMETETGFAPSLFCDFCGQLIAVAENAVAASGLYPAGVDDHVPCAYLHLGDCHDRWDAARGGGSGWEHLVDHLARLVRNVGLKLPDSVLEEWGAVDARLS